MGYISVQRRRAAAAMGRSFGSTKLSRNHNADRLGQSGVATGYPVRVKSLYCASRFKLENTEKLHLKYKRDYEPAICLVLSSALAR